MEQVKEKQQVKTESKKLSSLEEKALTIEQIEEMQAKLSKQKAELQSAIVQKGKNRVEITDFDSLTPEQRASNKIYFDVVDLRNDTVYEFNGMNISMLFGKNVAGRRAYLDGKMGTSFQYDNRLITFKYMEKFE